MNSNPGRKTKIAAKKPSPAIPTLPKHALDAPYSRLLTLGPDDYPEAYDEIAAQLRAGDSTGAAQFLVDMVLDEDYDTYLGPDYNSGRTGDSRAWTPVHALRVLSCMGPAAVIGVEPLLVLLDTEHDYLREDAPFYFAAVGEPAIESLVRVVFDESLPVYHRGGACESLAEIAELHASSRANIAQYLEQALNIRGNNPTLNGFIVCSLCDLGAKESFPKIEAAFRAGLVDEEVIDLPYIREHLGWGPSAPHIVWPAAPRGPQLARELAAAERATAAAATPPEPSLFDDEPVEPFVAPLKPGRNEPCPCGSGKKYKKCCGV